MEILILVLVVIALFYGARGVIFSGLALITAPFTLFSATLNTKNPALKTLYVFSALIYLGIALLILGSLLRYIFALIFN